MSATDRYVGEVMSKIQAPAGERRRIETDLRAHLDEALRSGQTEQVVIERMGDPAEVAAEFMSQVHLRYASFWRRLSAFLIDLGLIILLSLLLGILFIVLSNRVPQHPQGWEYLLGAFVIALCAGSLLAVLGIILLYFPILEGRFGQTLGKRLLRLRVLREDGLPVSFKEAFLRNISYYFEVLPVDALFIFFTAKRQRAFDIVARTIVIYELG